MKVIPASVRNEQYGIGEKIAPQVELEISRWPFESLKSQQRPAQLLPSSISDNENSRFDLAERVRDTGQSKHELFIGVRVVENHCEALLLRLRRTSTSAHV